MQDKKYFPIRTATVCQLKWTWSTVFLNTGTTASCHRIIPEAIPADFNQFHNTDKKLSDRKLMLDGQWPQGGCEYCQQIEQAGGSSDRLLHLDAPDLVPAELDTDPNAITVTPRILEVYLNNTCNFSCVYCSSFNSSKINFENTKYASTLTKQKEFQLSFGVLEPADQPKYMQGLLAWLDEHSTELKRLHILGGEPFYQREFDDILTFLSTHKNPHLELNIVTNLGINLEKLKAYIDQLKILVATKKIRRVDLTCSIDCWGAEQEFVRQGLDLNIWEENFNYLLTQRWLVLNINQTISVLTIKTMPALLAKLNEWRKLRPIGHFFSGVTPGPDYLKPHILGGEIFKDDFEQILSLMSEETEQDRKAKEYMNGIWLQISANDVNIKEVANLKIFLDEIDRRRNTNWKGLFLWLK